MRGRTKRRETNPFLACGLDEIREGGDGTDGSIYCSFRPDDFVNVEVYAVPSCLVEDDDTFRCEGVRGEGM